jgi:hypothetical protein
MEIEPQFSSLDPVARRALMSTMCRHELQPKQSVHLHDLQRCADAQPHNLAQPVRLPPPPPLTLLPLRKPLNMPPIPLPLGLVRSDRNARALHSEERVFFGVVSRGALEAEFVSVDEQPALPDEPPCPVPDPEQAEMNLNITHQSSCSVQSSYYDDSVRNVRPPPPSPHSAATLGGWQPTIGWLWPPGRRWRRPWAHRGPPCADCVPSSSASHAEGDVPQAVARVRLR